MAALYSRFVYMLWFTRNVNDGTTYQQQVWFSREVLTFGRIINTTQPPKQSVPALPYGQSSIRLPHYLIFILAQTEPSNFLMQEHALKVDPLIRYNQWPPNSKHKTHKVSFSLLLGVFDEYNK